MLDPRAVAIRVAADYVGCSLATINNWQRDPVQPFPRADRGVIDLNDVDAWLRARLTNNRRARRGRSGRRVFA